MKNKIKKTYVVIFGNYQAVKITWGEYKRQLSLTKINSYPYETDDYIINDKEHIFRIWVNKPV